MAPPDEYSMWLERERSGKNVGELERSYDLLMTRIKRVDPLTIAETTEGKYQAEGIPGVVVPFLQSWFVLDFLPYRVRAGHASVDTLPLKVLFLHHLLTATENQGTAVRIMGKWIDGRSLQHGAVKGAHFTRKATQRLSRLFTLSREDQLARVLAWGGSPIALGDYGFLFKFFPRLPVAFIHWEADDELPAYDKILFDVSASNYMPTHGIAALTEFLVFRLTEG